MLFDQFESEQNPLQQKYLPTLLKHQKTSLSSSLESLPLFFSPHNTKFLILYTLHPHFEPTYLYPCDVISLIEIILTTTEDTNLAFEKVQIAPLWSFILTLHMPSTLNFPTFPNLKWSNSLSILKVLNISRSLQMCFEAAESITHFILATSLFAQNTSSSSLTLFTTLAWELVPSLLHSFLLGKP